MERGVNRLLRGFGPAMPSPPWTEALRAAFGAALGLVVAGLVLSQAPTQPGALIAPFGATAFLIFAVPNSPLAQPWSAILGNTVAALTALFVVRIVHAPLPAAALAVGAAVLAMAVLRALHPPAGAVALLIALTADPMHPVDLWSALLPIVLGTVLLVIIGIGWNQLTGRAYPFRLPPPQGAHGTADPAADRRLALLPADLQSILDRLRLAPNLGAEDLGRALEAAEADATARHLGELTAADVMSRALITVLPDATESDVAATFLRHRFNTLPVRTDTGAYAGLIEDKALINADSALTAADLASPAHTLPPDAGLAALLPLLSDGHQQSVPILEGDQLVGIITRSDLVALLARKLRQTEIPT